MKKIIIGLILLGIIFVSGCLEPPRRDVDALSDVTGCTKGLVGFTVDYDNSSEMQFLGKELVECPYWKCSFNDSFESSEGIVEGVFINCEKVKKK